jgi:hypothetical protein
VGVMTMQTTRFVFNARNPVRATVIKVMTGRDTHDYNEDLHPLLPPACFQPIRKALLPETSHFFYPTNEPTWQTDKTFNRAASGCVTRLPKFLKLRKSVIHRSLDKSEQKF